MFKWTGEHLWNKALLTIETLVLLIFVQMKLNSRLEYLFPHSLAWKQKFIYSFILSGARFSEGLFIHKLTDFFSAASDSNRLLNVKEVETVELQTRIYNKITCWWHAWIYLFHSAPGMCLGKWIYVLCAQKPQQYTHQSGNCGSDFTF